MPAPAPPRRWTWWERRAVGLALLACYLIPAVWTLAALGLARHLGMEWPAEAPPSTASALGVTLAHALVQLAFMEVRTRIYGALARRDL